ncbi:MAG: hypothetical protein RLZZ205_1180 [Bacteroidota bacterium]|jgi:hypothetical protein
MKKKDQFIHICSEEWDEFTAEITVRGEDDHCACQSSKVALPDLKAVLDHVQSKVIKRNDFDLAAKAKSKVVDFSLFEDVQYPLHLNVDVLFVKNHALYAEIYVYDLSSNLCHKRCIHVA